IRGVERRLDALGVFRGQRHHQPPEAPPPPDEPPPPENPPPPPKPPPPNPPPPKPPPPLPDDSTMRLPASCPRFPNRPMTTMMTRTIRKGAMASSRVALSSARS